MFFELEKSYLGGGVLHPEWSHTSQPAASAASPPGSGNWQPLSAEKM